MARSDGHFPSYVKLDISPDHPPKGWDDGIRRCIVCQKAWPNMGIFSPSPCCNANAGIATGSDKPDLSWRESVKALLRSRFERYYERWNEGLNDEQLMWTMPGENDYSEQEYEEGLKDIENLIHQEPIDASRKRR